MDEHPADQRVQADIKLGERVRAKRGNMNLRAAASEIGVSPTTVLRIERGNIIDTRTSQKAHQWLGEQLEPLKSLEGPRLRLRLPPPDKLAELIVWASTKFGKDAIPVGHV